MILTDGYPDAPESAIEQALAARQQGIEIVAIGTGDADRDYLRRLASSEQASIFAKSGELVGTFGHIARVIAEGGAPARLVMTTASAAGQPPTTASSGGITVPDLSGQPPAGLRPRSGRRLGCAIRALSLRRAG